MAKKDSITINSEGGPVFTGKVDNRGGSIRGRSDKHASSFDAEQIAKLFDHLFTTIEQHPKLSKNDKVDARVDVEEIRRELEKKEQADEGFLMRRFRNLARIAPDILEVTLATVVHPALGLGVFARKLAEKARLAN